MKQFTLTVLLLLLGFGLRAQTLLLTAPNGGEVWLGGSVQTISWTYTNVDNIKIEYSLNNGLNWTIITASYPSSALSYTFTVPCIGSNQAKIRITNTLQFTQDESNTVFTIPEPTVNIIYPNGGESFGTGTGQYIEWATTGVLQLKVQYTANNGSSWNDIGTFPAGNNYCNWIAPDAPTTQTRIRAWNIESPVNRDSSAALFSTFQLPASNPAKYLGGPGDGYDMCPNRPDTIRVSTPNGGEIFNPTAIANISWTFRHVDNVKIEYSTNNGTSWNLIATDLPASQLSCNWTVPNIPSNQCRIKITSLLNGIFDISNAPFTINSAFVNVIYPNGGESFGVGTGQYIEWSSNSVNTIKLEYSADNGSSWTLIGTAPASNNYANWIPPAPITSQSLIRITDNDNAALSDVSDAAFSLFTLPEANPAKYFGGPNDGYSMNSTLPDSINVTSPNGGEIWTAASTRTITWTYNEVDQVKIEYTLDDGLTWSVLAASIPASQLSYTWIIPTTPSYTCRVRISDLNRPISDASDAVFVIPNSSVQILYPNGGEQFGVGTGQYIEWDYTDLATIKLEYTTDNGTTWNLIGTAPASHKYANWVVPAIPSNQLRIRATDIDNPIFTDQSNVVFSSFAMPTPSPTKYQGGEFDGYSMYAFKDVYVKVIKPNGGEIWGNGTTQQIKWTTLNTNENLKVEYSINNEATWTTLLNDVPNTPTTYNWNIASPVSTICKVRATTMSGVEFDKSDDFFTIANTNGITTNPLSGNVFCSSSSSVVNFSISTQFNPGNQFKVQLSDSVGLFSGSVINIGSITAVTPAAIPVVFPPRYYTSSSYRLRVISTNPPTIGTDNGTNFTINPLPKIRLGNDTSICAGTSLSLNVSGTGTSYAWSTGASTPSISVNTAGTYWVAVSNACGTSRDTISISTLQAPSISLGADTAICLNSAVVLEADSGAWNYQWSTGSIARRITAVIAGNYSVTASNACGTSTDAIVVSNLPTATLELGENDGLCPGETRVLTAGNPDATYSWSNGSSSQTISVNTPGTYSVAVNAGCGIVSDQITLYNGALTADAGDDVSLCGAGTAVTLSATGANTYSWSNGATGNSISVSPQQNTSYTVVGTNIYGCTDSDVVVVNVNTSITPTFPAIASVCQGATPPVLPTSSNNIPAITGTWNSTVSTASVGTTVYTFTPSAGQCASTTTVSITVNSQPTQPPTACYQTATFSAQTCSWVLTGTQPTQPPTACYQTAAFNTQTCAWVLTGTQPTQPPTACYQTATFNTQTCAWVLTGTQPTQPPTACYQTATFNTQTCAWVLTGTQPTQPPTACYQTATFNTQTCSWDVTGTQPIQPPTACYQTASFNTQTCAWVLTGLPNPVAVTTDSACSSYVWNVNGQSYTTSNTYTYFANCQDYQLNLTINQNPSVSFLPDNTAFCNNSASVDLIGGIPLGGIYSGAGVSNGEFNPSLAGSGLHPITYTYTDVNGCSNAASAVFEVAVCTGVETFVQPELEVRPNPMESSTLVSLKNYVGSDSQFNLLLMDATGRNVFNKNISAEVIREGYLLQIPDLANGTYLLMLNNTNYTTVKRLVK